MLVNLRAGAPLEDIEYAPPLGSQGEVRDILGAALPGIAFDACGRGVYTNGSGCLVVDVRNDEPAYTAIVTVRGDAGAAVARLLDESGWAAYVPRLGAFVSMADLHRDNRR